jgi:tRNA uridine 5-carboxymethylaminomethyl modification enzyme
VNEPYRMFTSRAEYRLMLREDNADLRLTEIGRRLGVVDDVRWGVFCRKQEAILRELERLKSTWVNPRILAQADAERVLGVAIEREYTLFELLRRPQVTYQDLMSLHVAEGLAESDPQVCQQLEIAAKYQGYIDRQHEEIERSRHFEALALPEGIDYRDVRGLSIEAQQKLNLHKPQTLGQAGRVAGVTPAAISLLLVYIKKKYIKNKDIQPEASAQDAA